MISSHRLLPHLKETLVDYEDHVLSVESSIKNLTYILQTTKLMNEAFSHFDSVLTDLQQRRQGPPEKVIDIDTLLQGTKKALRNIKRKIKHLRREKKSDTDLKLIYTILTELVSDMEKIGKTLKFLQTGEEIQPPYMLTATLIEEKYLEKVDEIQKRFKQLKKQDRPCAARNFKKSGELLFRVTAVVVFFASKTNMLEDRKRQKMQFIKTVTDAASPAAHVHRYIDDDPSSSWSVSSFT